MIDELLNLFKHSSLIWRISNEDELEKEYFDELEGIVGEQLTNIREKSINNANVDYYIRRKIEFDSSAGAVTN